MLTDAEKVRLASMTFEPALVLVRKALCIAEEKEREALWHQAYAAALKQERSRGDASDKERMEVAGSAADFALTLAEPGVSNDEIIKRTLARLR